MLTVVLTVQSSTDKLDVDRLFDSEDDLEELTPVPDSTSLASAPHAPGPTPAHGSGMAQVITIPTAASPSLVLSPSLPTSDTVSPLAPSPDPVDGDAASDGALSNEDDEPPPLVTRKSTRTIILHQ